MHSKYFRFTIFTFFFLISLITAEDFLSSKTIRVGFFDFPGYHETDDNNRRSGYGYEYLHEIAKYTSWKYDYIGGSWADNLELLKKGEIDLVSSAQYTPERAKEFDYTKFSIGTSNTILTVRAANYNYPSGDIKALNGIHVGLLKNNSRNKSFDDFCKKNNINYTFTFFNTSTELEEALQTGTVEGIITSNLRLIENERVVAEFDPSPYYIIVRKGNIALLNQLDNAIEQINMETPSFQIALYQKYYGKNNGGNITFTKDEQNYIEKNPKIKILLAPNLQPLYSYKNGKLSGIIYETLTEILTPSGLELEFVTTNNYSEYFLLEKQQSTELIGADYIDLNTAEQKNYRLTNPYLSMTFNSVSLINKKASNNNIAVMGSSGFFKILQDKNLFIKLIQCSELSDLMNKLNSGEVESVIMNTYSAEYLIAHDVRKRYSTNIIAGFTAELAIGVFNGRDPRLFSIINKCVNAIDKQKISTIITTNTNIKNKEYSFVDYLYLHTGLFLTLIIIFFIIVITIIIAFNQILRKHKENNILNETARYASLACESYDVVYEINLQDDISYQIIIENNRIIHRRTPNLTWQQNIDFFNDKLHPADKKNVLNIYSFTNIRDIIENNKTIFFEARLKDENNDYHWYYYLIQGITQSKEQPLNFMLFSKNINSIKHEEEQRKNKIQDALNAAEKANKAKSFFLSRMSHEMRTPLNGILGFLRIAQKPTIQGEELKNYLLKAETVSKHLLALINDILDMSAIETSKLSLFAEVFDFNLLISSIVDLFTAQAEDKKIHFISHIKTKTPHYFLDDKKRLTQILFNLLSNAIKFTPHSGTVSLEIEQVEEKEETSTMKFTVSDTGIGMSKDFMERLGRPFEQQSSSTSRFYGGTGLGLSITMSLIKMMHGSIDIQSEENKGSKFTVILPLHNTNEQLAETSKEDIDFSGMKVLLAEDNPMNQEIACELLKSLNITTDVAENGLEALKLFENSTPGEYNVILMDIQMPLMDGLEATRLIRKSNHPDAQKIYIAAMTADAFIENIEESKKAGMNEHISKPIDTEKLFEVLAKNYKK